MVVKVKSEVLHKAEGNTRCYMVSQEVQHTKGVFTPARSGSDLLSCCEPKAVNSGSGSGPRPRRRGGLGFKPAMLMQLGSCVKSTALLKKPKQ